MYFKDGNFLYESSPFEPFIYFIGVKSIDCNYTLGFTFYMCLRQFQT